MLLKNTNEDLRVIMTSCDLDEKEMLMLAREGNDETRKKLARRVVRQAEQKEPTSLSNVEINNVAELQVKRGMLKAIPALPDERQLEMLLLKKTISRHDVNFISEATTTSKPLMEYILENAIKHYVFENIAKNPSLPDDLQLKLLKRGLEAIKTETEAELEWNESLRTLISNSNVCEEALRYATNYLIESNPVRSKVLSYLIDCDCLPFDVIISIDKIWGEKIGEDWHLSILGQRYADRRLVERALTARYGKKEELQEYLRQISSLESKEWWRKLAESPFRKLHEVASLNIATDEATLVALLHDKNKDTFASTNPVLSADNLLQILSNAIAEGHDDPFSVVGNPNFPMDKLRDIANNGSSYESRSRAREALALRVGKAVSTS